MKIALCSDIHEGVHGVDEYIHEHCTIPWVRWFTAECVRRDVRTVWHLGDLFDTRGSINTLALNWSLDLIHRELSSFKEINLIVGNHDAYYKDKNDVASVNIFGYSDKIRIYAKPEIIKIRNDLGNELSLAILPWVAGLTDEQIDRLWPETSADICLGHMEVKTFETHRNSFYTKGLTLENLSKRFRKIYSGHFHIRAERGPMTYVGNPYETTWSDYFNKKGFYILDLDTMTHEFVQNTITPVHEKYVVQHVLDNPDKLNVKGNWLKLIIDRAINKSKDVDKAMKILQDLQPIEIRREILLGTQETATEVKIDTDGMKDPTAVLKKYVAGLEIPEDKKLRVCNIFDDVAKKVRKE